MKKWFQQQAWWIGIILTISIALFPNVFVTIGISVKFIIINYWLQISLLINIIQLFIIYRLLLKLLTVYRLLLKQS